MPAVVPVLAPVLETFEHGGSLRDAIRESAERLVANRAGVPWLRKDWRALMLIDPQVRAYQHTLDHLWDRDLAALLRAGTDAGFFAVSDPQTMAAVVRLTVDTVVDEIVMYDRVDKDAALEVLVQLLTEGLLARS